MFLSNKLGCKARAMTHRIAQAQTPQGRTHTHLTHKTQVVPQCKDHSDSVREAVELAVMTTGVTPSLRVSVVHVALPLMQAAYTSSCTHTDSQCHTHTHTVTHPNMLGILDYWTDVLVTQFHPCNPTYLPNGMLKLSSGLSPEHPSNNPAAKQTAQLSLVIVMELSDAGVRV